MFHLWRLTVSLLLLLLVGNVHAAEVQIDETGEATTSSSDAKITYSPAVIQLASTFPQDVLSSEDMALKVAAKLEYVKNAKFLQEAFVKEYGSAASVMLAELKEASNTELLETMEEVIQGMEDANHMFDGTDAESVLKEMEEDGYFEGVDQHLMDEYRMNPRKIKDDTKEGLLYEFIAIAHAAGYLEINDIKEDPAFQPLTDEEIAALEKEQQAQQQ